MKSIPALVALALLLALPGGAPLWAGSAEPGGVRTGQLGPSTAPLARRLVGRWRLVGFQSRGKPMPMPVPGNVRYVLVLAADGTAKMEIGQPTPRSQILGRWQLKGRRIAMQTKAKTELVDFQLTGDRLTIVTPGGRSGTRLVLQRIKRGLRP